MLARAPSSLFWTTDGSVPGSLSSGDIHLTAFVPGRSSKEAMAIMKVVGPLDVRVAGWGTAPDC